MTTQSASRGSSKRALMIVLAILAVIAVVIAVLWLTGTAPSVLDSGSHVKGSGSHIYRGIAALVVALILGAGAWFSSKKN